MQQQLVKEVAVVLARQLAEQQGSMAGSAAGAAPLQQLESVRHCVAPVRPPSAGARQTVLPSRPANGVSVQQAAAARPSVHADAGAVPRAEDTLLAVTGASVSTTMATENLQVKKKAQEDDDSSDESLGTGNVVPCISSDFSNEIDINLTHVSPSVEEVEVTSPSASTVSMPGVHEEQPPRLLEGNMAPTAAPEVGSSPLPVRAQHLPSPPDRIRPTYNHQGPRRSPNWKRRKTEKQTQNPSPTHGSGSDSGVHFGLSPPLPDQAESPRRRRKRTAQVMAAASRKEEERNERIVRGLLKLPPNRRCINCNGIGPQYVCTSFWTFICISCSGIHREFTHRVKSVSMSKFTVQEVEALQKGGNQRARESLLKDFDTQQMRLPDSSNINSLREFIRVVYVERRYAGVRFPERPPRDNKQSRTLTVINVSMIAAVYIDASEFLFRFKNHTKKNIEGLVPIIHFLEERRNGKQPAILTRKPGSDRGHDGKMSYRSNSLQERMSEDQFANETRESRTSDCSGSSVSDTVRTLPESPNFFDNGCSSAPFQQNQSDMLNFNGITQSQRTASTENIDSTTLKSGNSSLADLFFGSETAHGTQESNHFIVPSFVAFSDAVNGAEEDLFSRPNLQQQYATGLYPSVDFFANIPPTTSSSDKMPLEAPSLDNAGWATFDTPPKDKQPGVTGPSLVASIGKQTLGHDLFLFEPSEGPASFLTSNDKVSVSNHSGATYHDTSCSQLWHSFDDATGVMINDHSTAGPLCNEHQNVVNVSLGTSNPFTCSVVSE
ncbi:hypothetical protein ACQ4PT_048588 [Festuca glaucescens]